MSTIYTAITKRWPTLNAVHVGERDFSQTVIVEDTRLGSVIDETTGCSPNLSFYFGHIDHQVTAEEVVDRIVEVIDAWWAEHNIPSIVSEVTP